MTDRERLIELLNEAQLNCDDNYGMTNTTQMADYLLENGVIVPPVKVGDIVYIIDLDDYDEYTELVTDTEVFAIGDGCFYVEQGSVCLTYSYSDIGESIFFTREEAEKALKEREKNE